MTFKQLVHEAMESQRLGHSAAFAASLLHARYRVDVEEAHLIARAAEVYKRILDREPKRRGLEWV